MCEVAGAGSEVLGVSAERTASTCYETGEANTEYNWVNTLHLWSLDSSVKNFGMH